jgi:hypothetical protein
MNIIKIYNDNINMDIIKIYNDNINIKIYKNNAYYILILIL